LLNHPKPKEMKQALLAVCCLFFQSTISAAPVPGKKEQGELAFRENLGQVCDEKKTPLTNIFFTAELKGLRLLVNAEGITYMFQKVVEHKGKTAEEEFEVSFEKIHLRLKNSTIDPGKIEKIGPLAGSHNYFSADFQVRGVREYKKLVIREVYPGIDWVLYSENGAFKYDFIVHEGADASLILLEYDSPNALSFKRGRVVLRSRLGTLTEEEPYSFLEDTKVAVSSRFTVVKKRRLGGRHIALVAFEIDGAYKGAGKGSLIIDPVLSWSTLYGGSWYEGPMCLETDAAGNMFCAGYTVSTDLPLLNSGTFFSTTGSGFIIKYSPAGVLIWASKINGMGNNCITGMAIDAQGHVFACGDAVAGLPVVNNSTYFQPTMGSSPDAHILKFDNLGNLLWCSFFGGGALDNGRDLCLDPFGNVFMCGYTASNNMPLFNAGTYFQSGPAPSPNGLNSFIAKFSNSGQLLWSTLYHNCRLESISADQAGNVVIAGLTYGGFATFNAGGGAYFQSAQMSTIEGVLLKFRNNGTLIWATLYGGSNDDRALSVITDKFDNIIVSGVTNSANFPTQNAGGFFQSALSGTAGSDVFILKFDSMCVRQWATLFGGAAQDAINVNDNMLLDSCNNLYLGMESSSLNIPVLSPCEGGFFQGSMGGMLDIFLARFNNSTALTWATYVGGSANDFRAALTMSPSKELFVAGEWWTSSGLPSGYVFQPWGNAYLDTTFNGSDDMVFLRFSFPSSPGTFNYKSPACASDTTQLPVLSPGWVNGGQFSAAPGLAVDSLTGKVNPLLSAPGSYTVTYLLSSCACAPASTAAATFTILPVPSITIAGNATVCAGSIASFTASGATSYSWHTGAATSTLMLLPSTNTVISVTGSSSAGCISSKSLQLVVSVCQSFAEQVNPDTGLRVFPNPNKGSFTIVYAGDGVLELLNVKAQVIRLMTASPENNRMIRVEELADGVYFVRVRGSDAVQRIVVGAE
jgi:hypothetical protein